MAKTSNVPSGTITEGRLRPIMGTLQKSHYNHNLDLTPLINKRLFGVAYGFIDHPQASLYTLFDNPRKARASVRRLRARGLLAEVVVWEVPAYYLNK